jgi:hypothetical protein
VQFPLKSTPGNTSEVIPILRKAKKKSITNNWKMHSIGPLCFFIPQIPIAEEKITNKSKPRTIPKNV